jgi:UDP-N-acetylglucosamine 2-epimerase (non-hydrolysing)
MAQGDTASVLSSAVAAYYKKIPFAHVEAGLRTHNVYSPWPEEGNRAAVAPITTFHFAPSELSRENLLKENVSDSKIFVTGNTVIDALQIAVAKTQNVPVQIEGFDTQQTDKKIILVTGHRRENLGANFDNIFSAIAELARLRTDCVIVFPVHKNPLVRKQVEALLGFEQVKNIFLIEPQGYPEFVHLMQKAYFIVTDSGGIQEEASSLGVPVLVTRDTTERTEAVDAGGVRLVGTEKKAILGSCVELLEDETVYNKMASSKNAYGEGRAAFEIISILKEKL